MIIDIHTHIFPPQVIAARDAFLAAEPVFAELYGNPKAMLASAEELLASMDEAAIDVSVALGFAWSDPATCRLHNDYLLAAAEASQGRILAFCTLPLAAGAGVIEAEARRCVASGCKGFGELRPDSLNFDLQGEGGALLASLALELDVALLFHASEPVGHDYPGKGGLGLARLYDFIRAHPDVRTIGAHWGGGLPFYALMPEVKRALRGASFDTAASSLLYAPEVYRQVAALTGAESIVFGSDFPLLSQARSRRWIEEAGLDPVDLSRVLGDNARRLLRLA